MIGGQDEDSCGENPAGVKATRRLTSRPRKAKSCTEINSAVTSEHNRSFIQFVRLEIILI
ncbi:hypothetical protein [Priestia megaterium]|uniref:hypothetical protein n=1 Tax=Priestia megaterium TaxID=1404 RepID=UPI001ABF29C4|nr:hypothetical protein [Priestia megaterium]